MAGLLIQCLYIWYWTESIMTTTQFSSEARSQYKAKAYAAASAKSQFAPIMIPRREPGDHDVQIEILFCGICHSDLHTVRSEWSAMPTVYPCVPGHEIVGRVTKVGSGRISESYYSAKPDCHHIGCKGFYYHLLSCLSIIWLLICIHKISIRYLYIYVYLKDIL